jgi:hypothetical protein
MSYLSTTNSSPIINGKLGLNYGEYMEYRLYLLVDIFPLIIGDEFVVLK